MKLKSSEIVHHKDGNHRNNNIKNLQTVSHSEHMKIHYKGKLKNPVITFCLNCQKEIVLCKKHFERGNGKYCSNRCRFEHWKGKRPNERKKYKSIARKVS